MRKHGPADDQLVVIQNPPIEIHVDVLAQQPVRQLLDFRRGYRADRFKRIGAVPGVVEDPHVGIAHGALCRRDTYQFVDGLVGHGWMRAQGDQVIEPRHALAEHVIQQAKQERNRRVAGAVRDDHQDPLAIDRKSIARGHQQLRCRRVFQKLGRGALTLHQSLKTFAGWCVTSSTAVSIASSSSSWCSATSCASSPASIRRDMSWRAGMEQYARVSSTKPDVREKPAVSVTAARNRRMASGASRNHHGTPTYTAG